MLVALMTILFLGGSSGAFGPMVFIDQAMDYAKQTIMEDDRRKQATATLKDMKKRTKEYTKAIKKLSKELSADYRQYEAPEDKIDAVWARVFELNLEYTEDIIEQRFELRNQLTREEWAAMFPS